MIVTMREETMMVRAAATMTWAMMMVRAAATTTAIARVAVAMTVKTKPCASLSGRLLLVQVPHLSWRGV
jgi:hypothetical protein